jgi:DNA-binding NtrC family response regulator
MLQRLQISYLSKMGMQGVGVSTGEEAVRYLQDHKVDVVISDVRMPGPIDGIQLFHWVCNNRPELLHKFLLVSGALIEADDSRHCVDVSVPRIQKPFRFDDYARTIRQVLQV